METSIDLLQLPVLAEHACTRTLPRHTAPTYALRAEGEDDTQRFLAALGALTDRSLAHLHAEASALLPLLRAAGEGVDGGQRTDEELLFDLLLLGVLWRSCGARARRLPRGAAVLMTQLYRFRRTHPALKPLLDPIRARLAARLLDPRQVDDETPALPSLRDLDALLRWLACTGEYREECNRLERVRRMLDACTPARIAVVMHVLDGIARRFESSAAEALGGFTEAVDEFVGRAAETYRGREDYVLACRPRVEYHASMVGAEIMNRAMRADFAASSRRMVLLPGCMRGPHASTCRARQEDLDVVCTGCARDCRVHALQQLGRTEGFEVRIIPHSSDFSRWLRQRVVGTGIGVVGVACALNLLGGGYELRALGIPSQCVFLDAAGCAAHWHPTGVQTGIDIARLQALLRAPESDNAYGRI